MKTEIVARRPLYDDQPDGYLESDRDWLLNNEQTALRLLRAELKKRTAYPEFCTQPEKCAGKGKCMNDWVCND